jgi:hypothetical protein
MFFAFFCTKAQDQVRRALDQRGLWPDHGVNEAR